MIRSSHEALGIRDKVGEILLGGDLNAKVASFMWMFHCSTTLDLVHFFYWKRKATTNYCSIGITMPQFLPFMPLSLMRFGGLNRLFGLILRSRLHYIGFYHSAAATI